MGSGRLAFALLTGGVVLGGLLLRRRSVLRHLHGLLGAAALLALALGGLPGRGAQNALILLAAALALGTLLLAMRGRSAGGAVLAIHAMVGGMAYLLLAELVLG